jgi:hypothetical protein
VHKKELLNVLVSFLSALKRGLRGAWQLAAGAPHKPLLAVAATAFISALLTIALVGWLNLSTAWLWAILGQYVVSSVLASLYGILVVTRRLPRRHRYQDIAAGTLVVVLILATGMGVGFDRDRAILYIALFCILFLLIVYIHNKSQGRTMWRF